MKKLLLSILLLSVVFVAFGQDRNTAQEMTDELVAVYQLNDQQTTQMLVIQERKIRNLEEIETIKVSDNRKYRHKYRAIQQSTDASIRRMLSSEQMKVYQQRRAEWRKKRAARVLELKESGIELQELEDKLLEEGF